MVGRATRTRLLDARRHLLHLVARVRLADLPSPAAARRARYFGCDGHRAARIGRPAPDRRAHRADALSRHHAGAAARTIADRRARRGDPPSLRSEEHTSELQSLMRISYAVFCLKQKNLL